MDEVALDNPWIISLQLVLTFLSDNIDWILIFLVVWLFRDDIKSLASRLKRFLVRWGDAEGSMDLHTPPPHLGDQETMNTVAPSERSAEPLEDGSFPDDPSARPTTDEQTAEDTKPWPQRVHDALTAGDIDTARRIFDEHQAEESDPSRHFSNEVNFQFGLYVFANHAPALSRLLEIFHESDTDERITKSARRLAQCYLFIEEYDKAEDVWADVIRRVTDNEFVVRASVQLAHICRKTNQFQRAKSILLENIPLNTLKSSIYTALSDIEDELGNPRESALCLETALEYQPEDAELLFRRRPGSGLEP